MLYLLGRRIQTLRIQTNKGRKTGMLQYEDESSEDRGTELEEGTTVVRSLNFSAEEFEKYEKESPVSVINPQFSKLKQQDKDTPNGCFHLLFKGECLCKEKCSYSHDPAVMAATPFSLREVT